MQLRQSHWNGHTAKKMAATAFIWTHWASSNLVNITNKMDIISRQFLMGNIAVFDVFGKRTLEVENHTSDSISTFEKKWNNSVTLSGILRTWDEVYRPPQGKSVEHDAYLRRSGMDLQYVSMDFSHKINVSFLVIGVSISPPQDILSPDAKLTVFSRVIPLSTWWQTFEKKLLSGAG